jgi:hypothetical protein
MLHSIDGEKFPSSETTSRMKFCSNFTVNVLYEELCCNRYRLVLSLLDAISEGDNRLQCLQRGSAIILLFSVR